MYRVSLGLVSLLLCVLLLARNLDLLPDPDAAALARRQAACEAVAVECALAARQPDGPAAAAAYARAVARRTPDVLSVGVRDAAGALVVDTGDHAAHWTDSAGPSTPTHMHAAVPREDGTPWARVEVAFRPLPYGGWWRYVGGALFPLLAVSWGAWLVVTTLYLRAVFRRVDLAQARVVPDRVRATLDTLAEGVLVVDRDGVIALANEAFARAVGEAPDRLRGRRVSDLPWHAGTVDLDPADHPWVRVVREVAPQTGRVLGLRGGDGGRTLSVNATPILGDDGACRGALATFDDLTAVERARAAAEEASRAKGEFLANVSHEIRTPMNAILGMTDLVLEGELAPEQRECLGIAGEAATSLLAVINDLLDVAKIEAGKLDLDPVEFDPRAVLDDTLQALAVRAHKKGLELACEVAPAVPATLVGDPVRLRQVVVNLVGNAVQFTDRGEVVVRVGVAGQDPAGVGLHVAVADTGIGIPADKLQAIFEPFTQADGSTTRRFGGTGLGLTISSHLVRLMGGDLWAESQLGAGSTFQFTARLGLPSRPARSSPDVSLARGLKVLVVEDNPTTTRVLVQLLADLGLRPTPMSRAADGLAELRRALAAGNAYPLAVVDTTLPDADGFALVEQVAGTGLAGAVIALVSSANLQQDVGRCRRAGAGYLRKPVRRTDLATALGRVADPGTQSGAVPRPEVPAPAAGVPPGVRVLVVEDNPFNQKVATLKLGRWGCRVRVVGSGREALDALAAGGVDVMFTDIQMPDMDGFELTAAVRRREAGTGRRLPVVAMTAHAMKGVREKCLAGGMDDYVSKPIRDEDLLAALRRAFGHPAGEPATVRLDDTPPPAHRPVGAVFDERAALARVGGNRETLRSLVQVYHQDCSALLPELAAAVTGGDAGGVRAAAHTIKGMVSFFGATAAAEAALHLEQAGERGDLAAGGPLLASLTGELDRLSAALAPICASPLRTGDVASGWADGSRG